MGWEKIYAEKGEVQKKPKRIAFDFMKRLKPKSRILDVGCGTGRHLVPFVAEGHEVTGIDPSSTALRILRKRLKDAGLSAELKEASFQKLPFRSNSFDAVFCSDVLHHDMLSGCAQGAKEILRVLKPGGVLAVDLMSIHDSRLSKGTEVEPNTFVLNDGLEAGVPHHFFSKEEVESIFEGVEKISLKHTNRKSSKEAKTLFRVDKIGKWVLFARKR